MIIEYLSDHPDAISELAGWYVSEWRPYYGDTGPGDARVDLEARLSREALPVGIVAMEGDRVLATAALGLDVTTILTPSIIGLLVGHDHRRMGIGTALIKTCVDIARNLGHPRLYVSTSVLGGLLESMGWQEMGETKFLNDERGSVYVHDL
jgi:GNAT superfamily N-acetyltransferase